MKVIIVAILWCFSASAALLPEPCDDEFYLGHSVFEDYAYAYRDAKVEFDALKYLPYTKERAERLLALQAHARMVIDYASRQSVMGDHGGFIDFWGAIGAIFLMAVKKPKLEAYVLDTFRRSPVVQTIRNISNSVEGIFDRREKWQTFKHYLSAEVPTLKIPRFRSVAYLLKQFELPSCRAALR